MLDGAQEKLAGALEVLTHRFIHTPGTFPRDSCESHWSEKQMEAQETAEDTVEFWPGDATV